MLFPSVSFFLFAATLLLLYYVLPRRTQWWLLLGASYLFYFLSGAEYLLFILYTTLVTYGTAVWMQRRADREDAYVHERRESMEKAERKAYRAAEKKKRFRILLLGLLLGFGMLAVLKYTAFLLTGVNSILTSLGTARLRVPTLLLPHSCQAYRER